jgi:hypothetical protein
LLLMRLSIIFGEKKYSFKFSFIFLEVSKTVASALFLIK